MKKIIIIGATSGIGKKLAEMYAKDGCRVGITGRREKLLQELKETDPDAFSVRAFDITDIDLSIRMLEELKTELKGLDLLILSSGTGDLNEELDFETEKKTIDTNVTGFTNLADWAYNHFEKQGYGHFAAISSIGGLRGSREAPAYNASKAYQINYLEGLRQKAAKSGKQITVTDIRPGLVDTEMAKGEGLFWVMPVEKAAKQIGVAIKKKRKVVYVTKRWGFIAGLLKLIPGFIYEKM